MSKQMLILMLLLTALIAGCSGNSGGKAPETPTTQQVKEETENVLGINPSLAEKYGIPLTKDGLNEFASKIASAINSEDPNIVKRAEDIARSSPGEGDIHQLQLVFVDVHDFWRMSDGKLSNPKNAAELIERHTGTSAEYSVLVASLFKSLKYETRIALACGDTKCVMYPEVYLGKEDRAKIFLEYLAKKYGELYYHYDSNTRDCWVVVDNTGTHVGSKSSETNVLLFIYPDGTWKLPSELGTELIVI